jgi:hypothetical protein
LPQLEGTIAALELERHVHESGLVQIVLGSAQLLAEAREAEKDRQKLEALLRHQEGMKAVEARRAERTEILWRLDRDRSGIGEELLYLDRTIALYSDRRQIETELRRWLQELEADLRNFQSRRRQLLTERRGSNTRAARTRKAERLQALEDRLFDVSEGTG